MGTHKHNKHSAQNSIVVIVLHSPLVYAILIPCLLIIQYIVCDL